MFKHAALANSFIGHSPSHHWHLDKKYKFKLPQITSRIKNWQVVLVPEKHCERHRTESSKHARCSAVGRFDRLAVPCSKVKIIAWVVIIPYTSRVLFISGQPKALSHLYIDAAAASAGTQPPLGWHQASSLFSNITQQFSGGKRENNFSCGNSRRNF